MRTLYPLRWNLETRYSGRDINEKLHLNLDGKGPTRFFRISHTAVKLQDIETWIHVSQLKRRLPAPPPDS